MQVSPSTLHPILTAETHNFPCGVAPFPGAETGTGGRLRDVQATGRGAHSVAGISSYCVGNLNIPNYDLPWEDKSFKYPSTFGSVVLPEGTTVKSALNRVLRNLAVGSKRFLTGKVDRSVTGLIAQQPCVGPLHTPLANCGVVAHSHFGNTGTVVNPNHRRGYD